MSSADKPADKIASTQTTSSATLPTHMVYPHSAASATNMLIVQHAPDDHHTTTDNYAQAVNAAASARTGDAVSTATGNKPDATGAQSWKLSDAKRGAMEKVIAAADTKPGYFSTSPGATGSK